MRSGIRDRRYVANGNMLDSILVGYFSGSSLKYGGHIRAGIPREFRRVLTPRFDELRIERCPLSKPTRSHRRATGGRHDQSPRWLPAAGWTHSWCVNLVFSNGRQRTDCVIRDSPASVATRTLARSCGNDVGAAGTGRNPGPPDKLTGTGRNPSPG